MPGGYRPPPREMSRGKHWRSYLGFSLKTVGLFTWFVIFLLALLEIKRYYNIDLIPGYDSSVDDVYGMMRGTLSELFK